MIEFLAGVFALIFALSFLAIFLGLIKPSLVKKDTRGEVVKFYIKVILISFLLFAITDTIVEDQEVTEVAEEETNEVIEEVEEDVDVREEKEEVVEKEEEKIKYSLDISFEGEGNIDVEPKLDEYEEGIKVEVKAIPDDGWEFVSWEGDLSGQEEYKTIIIKEDVFVNAEFSYAGVDEIKEEIKEARRLAVANEYEKSLKSYEKAIKNWKEGVDYFFTLPLIKDEIKSIGSSYEMKLAVEEGKEIGEATFDDSIDSRDIRRYYDEKKLEAKYKVEDIIDLIDRLDTEIVSQRIKDELILMDFDEMNVEQHLRLARILKDERNYTESLDHYEAVFKNWDENAEYIFTVELIKDEIESVGSSYTMALSYQQGKELGENILYGDDEQGREIDREYDERIRKIRYRVEDILDLL